MRLASQTFAAARFLAMSLLCCCLDSCSAFLASSWNILKFSGMRSVNRYALSLDMSLLCRCESSHNCFPSDHKDKQNEGHVCWFLGRQTVYGDMMCFNVKTKKWRQIEQVGSRPCARSSIGQFSADMHLSKDSEPLSVVPFLYHWDAVAQACAPLVGLPAGGINSI